MFPEDDKDCYQSAVPIVSKNLVGTFLITIISVVLSDLSMKGLFCADIPKTKITLLMSRRAAKRIWRPRGKSAQ